MKLLIVIDMQNDFIDGTLGTPEAQAIVPNVQKKVANYLNNSDKVIFTRDTHGANYMETNEGKNLPIPHCMIGTDGWKIHADIDAPNCLHIDKPTFGFADWADYIGNNVITDFDEGSEIEIVGLCTDICVVSNALILKALFPENKITVDASCCAGVTPDTHKAALQTLKMCQINVVGE